MTPFETNSRKSEIQSSKTSQLINVYETPILDKSVEVEKSEIKSCLPGRETQTKGTMQELTSKSGQIHKQGLVGFTKECFRQYSLSLLNIGTT